MKKILSTVAIVLLCVGVAHADIYGSSLVGWWDFDNARISGTSVTDLSGNGNTLTTRGGPTTGRAGRKGQSMIFDGFDDGATTSNRVSLTLTGDTTVAGWTNLASTTGASELLIYADQTGTAELQTQNVLYELTISGGNDVRCGHEFGAGSNQVNVFDTNLTLNRWYHIACVRDATANTWILYIDGVAFGTYNYTTDADGGTVSGLCIAFSCATNGSYYSTGEKVDDVRIYSSALSAGDIKALYYYGLWSHNSFF